MLEAQETVPALSISAVYGGISQSTRPWRVSVQKLSQAVARMRQGVVSPINLSVVYHVPGEVVQPQFVGIRTGSFIKKANGLTVQIALPADLPRDVDAYLWAQLKAAVVEGERWAKAKKKAPSLPEIMDLVNAIRPSGDIL